MPHIPLWFGLCSCFYLKTIGYILLAVLVFWLCLRRSHPSDTVWVKFLNSVGWVWLALMCFNAAFGIAIGWKWHSNRQMGFGDFWLGTLVVMVIALGPGIAALFAAGRLRLEQKKEI